MNSKRAGVTHTVHVCQRFPEEVVPMRMTTPAAIERRFNTTGAYANDNPVNGITPMAMSHIPSNKNPIFPVIIFHLLVLEILSRRIDR